MMSTCPVCGKLTCIHWPEHWVYKRGQTYYCSAMCMDVDIVRDVNILKQVREDRRKRKEAKKMYNKLKKDGTPAKKSGPKPKKVEIPEPVSGGPWEKMETPEGDIELYSGPDLVSTVPADDFEIVETPEQPKATVKAYKVTGIRTENFGEFYYDRKFNSIDWRTEEGDEVSLPPIGWKNLMQEMPDILKALGVET